MIRHAWLAFVLCGAALTAADPLIPWAFRQQLDAQQLTWDIDSDGRLENGTQSVFQEGNTITIDGNAFNFQQRQMSADGRSFVFTGDLGNGLSVERLVRLDLATGQGRWVEVIRNREAAARQINLILYTRLNYGWISSCSETSANGDAGLGPKDGALAFNPPVGNQLPAIAWTWCHPASRVRPTIQVDRNSNRTVIATWALTVPAKGAVAVVHALAQQRLPFDQKSLAKITSQQRSRTFLADLAPEIRRIIVNWQRGSGASNDVNDVPEDLIPEPGGAENLTIGEQTRLHGSAIADQLVVTCARGTATVPFTRVAAIAGGAEVGSLYLRDGQVLTGTITGTVRFTLSSGLSTTLSPERLTWLVRCGLDKAVPHRLVRCADGQVLAASEPATCTFTTCWGTLEIPLDEVRSLSPADSRGGSVVVLEDGTQLFGHLSAPLVITNEFFASLTLDAAAVIGIHRVLKDEDVERELEGFHLLLAGDQVLVGEPLFHELQLATAAGVVPLALGSIHDLCNLREADGVIAALWDDDQVAGRLTVSVIPLRVLGRELQVPLSDILHLVMPNPALSNDMRERIATLVRDLGHEEWARREAASKALEELGAMAHPALNEALSASADPEVRARAEALLKAQP